MLNLTALNENIVGRVNHLRERVAETKEDIEISIGKLKEHLPELGELQLADEVVFTRLFVIEQQVESTTLKVYVDDEDDKVKVFDASINPKPIPSLQFVQYETGLHGYQVVQMGKHKVKIALSVDNEYRQQLENSEQSALSALIQKGTGTPPPNYLKYRPRATTPLRNLEIGVVYRAIEKKGLSKKYNASRYLIQAPGGTEFESYSNQSLERLISQKGLPCEFEVLMKKPSKDGKNIIVQVDSPDSASLTSLRL